MKRLVLLFSLLICVLKYDNAINLLPAPKSVVKVFSNGRGMGQFLYGTKNQEIPYCPNFIRTNDSGDFFIIDTLQESIFRFSSSLELKSKTDGLYITYINGLELSNKYLVAYMGQSEDNRAWVFRIDSDKNEMIANFSVKFADPIHAIRSAFIDEEDILFDSYGEIVSFKITGDTIVRDYSQKWTNYYMDGKQLMHKSHGIISYDAAGFFYSTKGQDYNPIVLTPNGKDSVNLSLGWVVAIDSRGWRYIVDLDSQSRIGIASTNGDMIRVFDTRSNLPDDVFTSRPCINANGDIFYLECSPKGHKLIKIARTW